MAQDDDDRRINKPTLNLNMLFIGGNDFQSQLHIQRLVYLNVPEIGNSAMYPNANPEEVKRVLEHASAASKARGHAALTRSGSSTELTESFQKLEMDPEHEPANCLIGKSQFKDAISLLEKLSQTQPQQLMLAECYFQLDNYNKAMRSVGKLETMMTSSPRPKVDDVMKTIDIYINILSCIRASTLLSCATKLYKMDSNPNDAVRGIMECSRKASIVIKQMTEQSGRMRRLAKKLGAENLFSMLSDLRSVTGADASVKTVMEAKCSMYIGLCYRFTDENLKTIKFYQQGIDLMDHKFGSNAMKYGVFGDLLCNTGVAYELQGNYVEAENFYFQSLESFNKAEDWENDSERRECVDMVLNNAKRVRMELNN